MSSTATPQAVGQDHVWSVTEHLEDILATVRVLDPIELRLLDAQGCVLVEDVAVPLSLPPFDNSSMDGYAVRVADVAGATEEFPAVLTVIGDVAAGRSQQLTVGPGQAARIMTGQVQAPISGAFKFSTVSDDGIRVWVNGQLVINNWTDHASTTNTSASINLTAGTKYSLKVEYYEHTGNTVAKLQWSYPGQATQIIPQSRLFR